MTFRRGHGIFEVAQGPRAARRPHPIAGDVELGVESAGLHVGLRDHELPVPFDAVELAPLGDDAHALGVVTEDGLDHERKGGAGQIAQIVGAARQQRRRDRQASPREAQRARRLVAHALDRVGRIERACVARLGLLEQRERERVATARDDEVARLQPAQADAISDSDSSRGAKELRLAPPSATTSVGAMPSARSHSITADGMR